MRRAAAALFVVLAACGAGSGGSTPPRLTVLAAASLTRALQGDAAHRYSFAGSQQLAAQVEAGAPADVIVTADEATMDRLIAKHLVTGARTLAHNALAIVVRPGNPRGIAGLADLARPGVAVVLADPTVPAGKYAAQALAQAGVAIKPVSLELDVESARQKVALGQADAAVVYATDARGTDVAAVPIPARQNVLAVYVGAVVAASGHAEAARRFLDDLPARLQQAGFQAP